MTQGAETTLDGSTLVVRIPMRFQRRGGRKRIVAPDGSEIVPTSKPQPDGTLVKALARAWRWQKLLDDGVYTSVTEIAEAEDIEVGGTAVPPSGGRGVVGPELFSRRRFCDHGCCGDEWAGYRRGILTHELIIRPGQTSA